MPALAERRPALAPLGLQVETGPKDGPSTFTLVAAAEAAALAAAGGSPARGAPEPVFRDDLPSWRRAELELEAEAAFGVPAKIPEFMGLPAPSLAAAVAVSPGGGEECKKKMEAFSRQSTEAPSEARDLFQAALSEFGDFSRETTPAMGFEALLAQ